MMSGCDAREHDSSGSKNQTGAHQEGSKSEAEINAVQKRTMAIFAAAPHRKLAKQVFQANQKPSPKNASTEQECHPS